MYCPEVYKLLSLKYKSTEKLFDQSEENTLFVLKQPSNFTLEHRSPGFR